eukprot:GCRY01000934.1.p1 GENE.GCRY01000934.1~~GCRY01000934.1.p1  ORF type:complete len:258 (+),score=38.81 GCRY01000934.1:330-1103(+)
MNDNPFILSGQEPTNYGGGSQFSSAQNTNDEYMLRKQLENAEARLQLSNEKVSELENRLYPLIPNWPSCHPIIFHDIAFDMHTPATRSLCTHGYRHWFFEYFSFTFNFVCFFALMVNGYDDIVAAFFLSLAFLVVFPVLSFFTWYQKLYNCLKKDKSSSFGAYFAFMFLHTLFSIMMVIGLKQTASGGFILAIKVFDSDQKSTGYLLLVNAFFWLIILIDSIYISHKSNVMYRSGELKVEESESFQLDKARIVAAAF